MSFNVVLCGGLAMLLGLLVCRFGRCFICGCHDKLRMILVCLVCRFGVWCVYAGWCCGSDLCMLVCLF